MIRKIFLVCLGIVCFTAVLAAQDYRQANAEEAKAIREKIETASAALKTLTCNFEQTKTLSVFDEQLCSSGEMTYRQPDEVHWAYVKPSPYVFELKGNRVTIDSGGQRKEIDASSSRLFKEISSIIVAGINGKGIFDEKRFAAQFQTGNTGYLVALSPKQKAIKQSFNKIELLFNNDCHIHTIKITENGGDQTVIRLLKVKINQ